MAQPWITIASATTPDGKLELRRRGERDHLLTIGGRVLMSSAAHRSEDALARIACAHLGPNAPARVLVGGLGMGFTLRAALDAVGPRARVTVAELNPVVAAWCREHLGALCNQPLDDRRAELVVGDVMDVVANAAPGSLDAVMIDLYEGPATRLPARHPLYGAYACRDVFAALAPGGVYAVWCEQRSPSFEAFLAEAGFEVRHERAGHGERVHRIYVATRPAAAARSAARPRAHAADRDVDRAKAPRPGATRDEPRARPAGGPRRRSR